MTNQTRRITNKIYEAVDEGSLSWQQVAEGALAYMSEQQVAEMAHSEEFFLYETLDEDEDEDEDEDLTLDELAEIALDTVNDHIALIRETAMPHEIGEQIRQLAYDSVIGNGGDQSQALIIGSYIRTKF